MRQVFNQYPWIPPEEFDIIQKIYYKHGRLNRISKNSILKSGGECNKLFFLKKGLCMYIVNYEKDNPKVLSVIPPGRALGDLSCLSGEKVNVTTLVKRDSEVLTIPPDILQKYMKEDFAVTNAVIKTSMAKQECHLEGMIANFTLNNENRLKVLFKALLAAYNIEIADWNPAPLKLNNSELGMITSATRVTVSRILNKWTTSGLIKRDGKNIILSKELFNGVYDWHDEE